MTIIDDDARDYRVHTRIENAVRCLKGHPHKLARRDALGALLACSERAANANLEHMIEAIIEGQGISREDLAERIQAVIELDEEEASERAIAAALNAEMEAVFVPDPQPHWRVVGVASICLRFP